MIYKLSQNYIQFVSNDKSKQFIPYYLRSDSLTRNIYNFELFSANVYFFTRFYAT